jgi:hypothetical protein
LRIEELLIGASHRDPGHLAVQGGLVLPKRMAFGHQACGSCEACAAVLRRHSRHRQSPLSVGIGSRAVSSAHQHDPDSVQVNSVPHREQATCREG